MQCQWDNCEQLTFSSKVMSDQWLPAAFKSPASYTVAFLNLMWSICNNVSNSSIGVHAAVLSLWNVPTKY